MVRGLDIFQRWFAAYADQYVLIGGTAASLTMEEAGLPFRATKDLDIVLHVEALTPAFGDAFWKFVEAGGYAIRQSSDTGKPIFYRFQKPAGDRLPAMVELLARALGGLPWVGEDRLIPLEAIACLDLAAREKQGAKVDAKDVRKHLNDVLRLSQLLTPHHTHCPGPEDQR